MATGEENASNLQACAWCAVALADDSAHDCPSCSRPLVLANRYRIGANIGRGGASVVHVADVIGPHPPFVMERVAVKSIDSLRGLDAKALELFQRGAAVLKTLKHPSIVQVYDAVEDALGRPYVVEELLLGGTLQQRIAFEHQTMDRGQLRTLLIELLMALDYLHQRVPRLVHRDLKPENILFRTPDDWHPILADLDSVALPANNASGLTIVVSPGYTAPEQLAGEVSPASDLYSLGMTMIFVATHMSPEDLPRRAGRLDLAPLLEGLEPQMRQILLKLVQPTASQRYASAAEVLKELVQQTQSSTNLELQSDQAKPKPKSAGHWTNEPEADDWDILPTGVNHDDLAEPYEKLPARDPVREQIITLFGVFFDKVGASLENSILLLLIGFAIALYFIFRTHR